MEEAFLRILSRPPNEIEMRTVTRYYQSLLNEYKANPKLAKTLVGIEGEAGTEAAAWTGVVRMLFSTDEAINKN